MKTNVKNIIQKIISEGDLHEGINLMLKHSNEKTRTDIVVLSSRLHSLDREFRLGIIRIEDYHVERNRIIYSASTLVNLIDEKPIEILKTITIKDMSQILAGTWELVEDEKFDELDDTLKLSEIKIQVNGEYEADLHIFDWDKAITRMREDEEYKKEDPSLIEKWSIDLMSNVLRKAMKIKYWGKWTVIESNNLKLSIAEKAGTHYRGFQSFVFGNIFKSFISSEDELLLIWKKGVLRLQLGEYKYVKK